LREEDDDKYEPILLAERVSRDYFFKYAELSHLHHFFLIDDKLYIVEVRD
jgi:hypothetical protein